MAPLKLVNLRKFLQVITVRTWLKRLRMIVVRLLFLVFVIYFVVLVRRQQEFHLHQNGNFHFNLTYIVALIFILWFITMILTTTYWEKFAKENGWRLQKSNEYISDVKPSSFLRTWRLGFMPIVMQMQGMKGLIGTQLYKEGGIIRWREYKLDASVRIFLPPNINLPQILADATPQDEAKLSNIYNRSPGLKVFRTEGEAGTHYRMLTNPANNTDALTIFSPDVLMVMLEKLPGVDVEINGQTVWFVYRNIPRKAEAYAAFVQGVGRVLPELQKQMHGYHIKQ